MPSSLSLLHSSCASCRVTGPVANATGLCIRHESPRGVSFTEPSCKRDGFLDAAPSSFTLNGQNPTPPPARFCAQPSTSNTPRKLELAYVCARRWCLTKDQVDSRNHEESPACLPPQEAGAFMLLCLRWCLGLRSRQWFVLVSSFPLSSCASCHVAGPVANATGLCIWYEPPRGVSFTEPSCKRDGFLDLAPSSFLRVVLLYHMPSSLSLLHSSCASCRVTGPAANATGLCIRHESPRGVSFTEPSCKRDGFLDLAPSSFLRVVLLYHMPSSLSLLHSSCASCRVTGPAANATGLCIRHESPRGVSFTEPSCKRDGFLDAAPSSFKLNGQNPTPARFCAQSPARLTPPGSWSSHMSALEGGVSQKTK
ncbi:hypothetical protein BJ322DRAFT_1025874 [Thelephora terrestris]|uniref:Uncharacterized protein n=1 Tax=Thelephora terrestris TaxID=56493 RepID=A0A9P6H167_9AGAM|nr:hypothetical protein BJ322DRAFT_1025874 [Thelephora terrestris]